MHETGILRQRNLKLYLKGKIVSSEKDNCGDVTRSGQFTIGYDGYAGSYRRNFQVCEDHWMRSVLPGFKSHLKTELEKFEPGKKVKNGAVCR